MEKPKKPECPRCGKAHWKFIPCAEVESADVYYEEKAAAREKAKVIPQARTRPARTPITVSRNFVETAPGVFHRRRSR